MYVKNMWLITLIFSPVIGKRPMNIPIGQANVSAARTARIRFRVARKTLTPAKMTPYKHACQAMSTRVWKITNDIYLTHTAFEFKLMCK